MFKKIANEYWFIDGFAQFADGDVGDYNHEAIVIETLLNQYDIPFNPHSVTEKEWVKWACSNYSQVINLIKNKITWDSELSILEKQNNCNKLFSYLFADGALDDQLFYDFYQVPNNIRSIINGQGDARLYAIQQLGWQRVQRNNVEVWNLNSETINSIITAFNSVDDSYDFLESNEDEKTINIYVFSNKNFYENVPLSALTNPKELINYLTMKNGQMIANKKGWIKLSDTAKEFPLKGILQRNGDYYYLSVDSRIFVPFLSLIDKDNVVHPKEVMDDDKNVGAHITVIKAKEGENLEVKEIGDTFEFFIDGFKTVKPEGWEGVEQVYFISVNSKELESLRKKYDLPAKVDGHEFHITVGVEKEANNWYQKIKTASNSFIDQIQLGSCTENTLVIYINGKRFSYSNVPGQQIYYEIKRWKNWKNKMEAGKKVSILLRNIDKNLQKPANTDLNKNKENSLSLF